MTMFPETRAGWVRFKFGIRALLCEKLIGWAYWVAPKGYTPSPSEALADEIRKATPEHRRRFMEGVK